MITPIQIRMARAALGWGIKDLSSQSGLSTETVTRAERNSDGITVKTWGSLQRAFEEAGIEFLSETESVSLHADPREAAICADPGMPLGIRRIYAR